MVFLRRTLAVIFIVLFILLDVILSLKIPASSPATFALAENGVPCLLASFNASLTVSYEKLDEQTNQTHAENVSFVVPPWSVVEGRCSKPGEKSAVLSLTWNDSFTLSFRFHEKSSLSSGRWFLQRISLRFDPSNPKFFPNSSQTSDETFLVASNLTFLGAKSNRAYVCPLNQRFRLVEKDAGSTGYLNLYDIKLQPFGVTGIYFHKESTCKESQKKKKKKKKKLSPAKTSLGNTSSLVVASCLALIVLIVVIVYVISRSSAISGYTSM